MSEIITLLKCSLNKLMHLSKLMAEKASESLNIYCFALKLFFYFSQLFEGGKPSKIVFDLFLSIYSTEILYNSYDNSASMYELIVSL